MIFDLVIQIFMAASFISGITMIVFTLGYKDKIRKVEIYARCTIGILLVYSVIVRLLIMLPGKFEYARPISIGFDILYIALCIFGNILILRRGDDRKS